MAAEIPKGVTEKLATGGSAFTTGVAMSFLVKKWPAAGIIANILLMGGGLVTACVVKGWPAEIAEGVGAGGAAILGSTIAWLPGAGAEAKGAGRDGLHTEIQQGDQKVNLQLKSGPVGATGEAAAKAARASVLEF